MPLKKRPETHRPIQMAIFDIFARFTSALLPSSSFNGPVSCFPLLPLLEHLTLDAGSLARFLLLFLQLIWTFLYNFFLVQLLSFLSFSLCARCCSGQIHCRKRELSGAESITRPKLYTLHCQHQSLSQWVSEWEYMTTLQLLISTSISRSSTTTAEMIRFLLGEESE